MKLLSIVIGLLILPAMVYYQKSIKLSGVVINEYERTPLVDCHVYISSTDIGTVTDKNGRFSLQIPIIHGKRPLVVSHVGFTSFEEKISKITKNELQITMQPAIIQLDEIVITPGKELLVDQAIDQVMAEYESQDEMLEDFYTALFVLDQDQDVLKMMVLEEEKE